MTIVEIINAEDGKLTRIDYVSDYKIEVIKSHGMSYLSARTLFKEEFDHVMGLDVRNDYKNN